jgi:hypothetical protein
MAIMNALTVAFIGYFTYLRGISHRLNVASVKRPPLGIRAGEERGIIKAGLAPGLNV